MRRNWGKNQRGDMVTDTLFWLAIIGVAAWACIEYFGVGWKIDMMLGELTNHSSQTAHQYIQELLDSLFSHLH